MSKRNLYQLSYIDHESDVIQVVRTDNNYGVQGYVYKDGRVVKRYTPYAIPKIYY
jgi:hypothetical protein